MLSEEFVEEVLDWYLNLERDLCERISKEDIESRAKKHVMAIHKSNLDLLNELKKELIGE